MKPPSYWRVVSPRSKVAVGFVAAVATLMLSGCSGTSTHLSGSVSTTPAGGPVSAGPIVRGVCLDPTGSTPASFSRKARSLLVVAIKTWVPATFPRDEGGDVEHRGLVLVVRTVSTNPYSTSQASLMITIPTIPKLPPEPSVTSGTFEQLYEEWKNTRTLVDAARSTSARAAAAGADELASLSLSSHTRSGIIGCVSALAVTTPTSVSRAFLVASDLSENVTPQVGGSLANSPVTLLQSCPSGDVNHCSALAAQFMTHLRELHAGAITVVRAELADSLIPAWIVDSP